MLFDIDRHTDERDSPLPNVHDVLDHSGVAAKATNSVNYVTQNTNLSLISPGKNGQFTVVQTGLLHTGSLSDSAGPGVYKFGTFIHDQKPHNLPFTPVIYSYELPHSSGGFYRNLPEIYMQVGNDDGTNNPDPNGGWFSWRMAVDSTYVYLITDYLLYNFSVTPVSGNAFRYYLLQQVSN